MPCPMVRSLNKSADIEEDLSITLQPVEADMEEDLPITLQEEEGFQQMKCQFWVVFHAKSNGVVTVQIS